jgi:hypothetical protein
MKNEELNGWFNSLDFITMEKMTRLKQCNFSDEDGYQNFVDACENWWNSINLQEKKSAYDEWNNE